MRTHRANSAGERIIVQLDISMRDFYKKLHPMGRLGLWGLPVFLVVAFALFSSIREQEAEYGSGFADLFILKAGEEVHKVRLGPDPASGEMLSRQHRPLSEETRQRVLSRLNQFRVEFRQLGPRISVTANSGRQDLQTIAQNLTYMIKQSGLGSDGSKFRSEPVRDGPVTLLCPPREFKICYAFLSAIAPYIHGEVAIVAAPALATGRMQLFLHGAPRYKADGAAVLL